MAHEAQQTLVDWLQDALEHYIQEQETILAKLQEGRCTATEKEALTKLLPFMAEDMCRLRRALAPVDRSQLDSLGQETLHMTQCQELNALLNEYPAATASHIADLLRDSELLLQWTPATIPPKKPGKYIIMCENYPGILARNYDGCWDSIYPVKKWMPFPSDT